MFNRLHDAVANTTQVFDVQLTEQIEDLERQLAELREQQAQNKERQQKQLTLMGALQSALGQVIKSTMMAGKAEEHELCEAFWEEIDAIKKGEYLTVDLAELPEVDENPEAVEPEPQPSPNSSNGSNGSIKTHEANGTNGTNQVVDVEVAGQLPPEVTITQRTEIYKMGLSDLKKWVRRYTGDDHIRSHGSLRERATWEKAAQQVYDQLFSNGRVLKKLS